MVVTTPKLALPKGQGPDSARDYLKGTISGGGLWRALEILDNAILSTGAITLDNATLNDPTITGWSNANHNHSSAAQAGSTLGPGSTLATPTLQTPAVSGAMTFGGDVVLTRTAAGVLGLNGALSSASGILGRLTIGSTGTVTVSPDAGVAAITLSAATGIVTTTGDLRLDAAAGAHGVQLATGGTPHLSLYPSSSAFYPVNDAGLNLGLPANRWGTVYAFAGTINTSLAEAKTDITPLAPAAALAAVLATDPVTFTYTAPPATEQQYELPDDPEQAEAVLYQRLVNAPLQEAARSQAGFVLHDATGTYQTDPLFETGFGQSSPQNSVGVLIGAIHALEHRLAALEGA